MDLWSVYQIVKTPYMVYGNKNSTFDYLEDMHLFKMADALTASPSKNYLKTDHYLLLFIGNL